jgi:hypothetical protein
VTRDELAQLAYSIACTEWYACEAGHRYSYPTTGYRKEIDPAPPLLLSVNYFIRASFAAGRADCLSLLFCGKLDLFDIAALCELYALDLCRAPRFLPPWISDPRYLLAVLTFSTFTGGLSMEPLAVVVDKLLDSAPIVRMPLSGEGG